MKQIRKHLLAESKAANDSDGQLVMENGLVMRQVPLIRKLQYDSNTGDYMIYKRKKVDAKVKNVSKDSETEKLANQYENNIMLRLMRQNLISKS